MNLPSKSPYENAKIIFIIIWHELLIQDARVDYSKANFQKAASVSSGF